MTACIATNRERVGLVQTHGPRALLAARLAHVSPARMGHVFHESPRLGDVRSLGEAVLTRGAHLAANSPSVAKRVELLTRRSVAVLPPILFVPDSLPREDARRTLGLPDGRIVGFVGRLSRIKRADLAVDAVARLIAVGYETTLVVLGDGPERAKIEMQARRVGVPIMIFGHVPRAAGYFLALDALISPSPSETFGLSLTEAVLCGVPVVASESPGSSWLGEELVGCDSVRIVAPESRALAAALAHLFGDVTDTGRAGAAQRLISRYGASALRPTYEQYYARCIASCA